MTRLKTENSWLPLAFVAILLILLVVLAALQYTWLGQISDAETVRLRSRLTDDTQRFSEDFNREVQTAYFGFQAPADVFKPGQKNEFTKRYYFWQENSRYPGLVEGIYFYRNAAEPDLLKFDGQKGEFSETEWDGRITAVRKAVGDGSDLKPVLEEPLSLVIPVFEENDEVTHVLVRTRKLLNSTKSAPPSPLAIPEKFGFAVLLLNREVIMKNVFPDLVKKYFSDSEGANYNLAITDKTGTAVFSSNESPLTAADSSASIFDVTPNGFNFIAERTRDAEGNMPAPDAQVVLTERFESRSVRSASGGTESRGDRTVDVNVVDSRGPSLTVFESRGTGSLGVWTLRVQHIEGSLDQFVTNTRRRNLVVSFGILALLAVSTVFIFLSSQRAKRLAQNQLDFVSSVSHEFRTPLAVIYSAAENLTDGVVKEDGKISDYGRLIKKEGRKLSGMVEQILAFAGARSGKRRYDIREIDAGRMVELALEEMKPQIADGDFDVTTEIAANVPAVRGDEQALAQAVQNLVSNAMKYSNGGRRVRVSVSSGDGGVAIAVEDEGIGIARDDLKKIFDPFFRTQNVVDEQISGNGLGLSLVRQIVDAHGGTIEVESEPGKGSRFVILLAGAGGNGHPARSLDR